MKGPVNDWPLIVGDVATFSRDSDFEPADLIYTDHATENMQTYYRPGYKWYYLSDHKVSEVIVFKQADSLSTAISGNFPAFPWKNILTRLVGVPHCSCANPWAPEDEPPRESIEVRVLAFYDE